MKVKRRFGETYLFHPAYYIIRKFGKLLATCLIVGFFLGSFFEPEDGSSMFLRNIG
jgi:hypothetical protein